MNMDYLDYLADYAYDDLPPVVRATVSRADYTERRELTLMLREPEEALPGHLAVAFTAATGTGKKAAQPRDAKPVSGSAIRWLPWLAAAGWLFFVSTGAAFLLRQPKTVLVEKTISAPAPAPRIVTVTDTLYQRVDRVIYRTKYDTVYREVSTPPRVVYVRDTLYLPPAKPVLVKGSSNLRGKERVLDFLFSTD